MRARAATISSRSAGERLPVPSAAELRRLAVTLNAMLDRLDEGLDRERRFVADASHELRTPLALLLTEVELALSGPRSPEELRDALRSAEEEVRRLIALSEDLLALAGATPATSSCTPRWSTSRSSPPTSYDVSERPPRRSHALWRWLATPPRRWIGEPIGWVGWCPTSSQRAAARRRRSGGAGRRRRGGRDGGERRGAGLRGGAALRQVRG